MNESQSTMLAKIRRAGQYTPQTKEALEVCITLLEAGHVRVVRGTSYRFQVAA